MAFSSQNQMSYLFILLIKLSSSLMQLIRLIKMNLYYFGDSLQYIEAQYAASNRSTCKTCKQKIDKDQLRLGLILDDDHFNAKYWYHLKCFQLKPRHKELQQDKIEQKIYNIDQLQKEDYDAVIQHIKQELNRIKNNKKPGKKQTKKQTKKQSKKVTKNAKKTKDQSSQSEISSESQSEDDFSSSSSQQSDKKKKKKRKPMAKKVPIPVKAYTLQQQQQFKELVQKYQAMTVADLKQILGKNNQSKNGTKTQLAQKCADGKLLGQIPKCSSCGGGRLRFQWTTGRYSCPGYMEDTDFKNCGKKYAFQQIKRLQWVE